MDSRERTQIELQCLYDMFGDRLDEDVVYIIYNENSGNIEKTVEQLLTISASSVTGYYYDKTIPTPTINEVEQNSTQSISDQSISSELATSSSTSEEKEEEQWMTIKGRRRCKNSQSKSNGLLPSNIDLDQSENVEDEDGDCDDAESIKSKIKTKQEKIINILEEKKNIYLKAAYYRDKKMFPVSGFYSELARQLDRRVTNMSNELVEYLLKQTETSNSIDLHGLNLNQSCLLVKRILEDRKQKLLVDRQGETCFDIITGWGKHSVLDGKIRSNIISMLRDQGLIYYHLNKGTLRVTITRR